MTPTHEQLEASRMFESGESFSIDAYAGSGKTTTLEYLARQTARHGVYLAFNSSIVRDAKVRFPSNVRCSTIHALAWNSIKTQYGFRPDKLRQQPTTNLVAG